jgi:hypothetical protein
MSEALSLLGRYTFIPAQNLLAIMVNASVMNQKLRACRSLPMSL